MAPAPPCASGVTLSLPTYQRGVTTAPTTQDGGMKGVTPWKHVPQEAGAGKTVGRSPEQVRIGEAPSLEPAETPEQKRFPSSAQKETGAPGRGSGVCCTQLDEALAVSIWRGLLWPGTLHILLPPLFPPEQLNAQASGLFWSKTILAPRRGRTSCTQTPLFLTSQNRGSDGCPAEMQTPLARFSHFPKEAPKPKFRVKSPDL